MGNSITFTPKFVKGDEVFYMYCDKIQKGIVQGTRINFGKIEYVNIKIDTTEDAPIIEYCVGAYMIVEEHKCFASQEKLIESLLIKTDGNKQSTN